LDSQPFEDAEVFGASTNQIRRLIAEADLLLNFACALRQPLLSLFKRRALLDGDPGHLQIAQSVVDLGLDHHDVFLTVGARINASFSRFRLRSSIEVGMVARRFSSLRSRIY
jgi:hypothetical protein